MKNSKLKKTSMVFQWNFYERTISNYSIIMKMFRYIEDRESLIHYMPKVFVDETVFDMCQIIQKEERGVREGFFSLSESARGVALGPIEDLTGPLCGPSLLKNAFGYGTLFIYPFRRDIDVFGYLLLGKKEAADLDEHILRELEMLCEILSKSLLLNTYSSLKTVDESRLRDLDSKLVMTSTLLESVIDQFPHALLLVDRNGRVCFANQRAKKELNEQAGLLIGERIENIVSGIESGFCEKDTPIEGEIQYRSGDRYRYYKMEGYPIKDSGGKVLWKSLVLKDVMEERLAEEENIHRGKMESIGRLAGGVAHDFNNLLTGVLGYASLIKKSLNGDQQLYRYAEVIESSARRAASLTQHLLNFSRRQRKSVGVVDINLLLDDVLFLLKESFRNVEIEQEFDTLLPPIKGDEAELQHAFLNLCVNAKDAMSNGGKLTVRTERKSYDGKNNAKKEYALIEIQDNGCGIDQDVKKKIFEPFFSTKTNNTKLGMGLYLVDKTIRNHGGFIEVESEPSRGTKFRIYIPLQARQRESKEAEKTTVGNGGNSRILMIDDEDIIRELMLGVLRREGFEVLDAPNGKEGLRIFKESANPFDLVIVDMLMPGLKGEDVLKRLKTMSQAVKVIVSSGFMSEEQRDKLKEYGVDGFLDKPYRDRDVLNIVNKVLSKKSAPSATRAKHA